MASSEDQEHARKLLKLYKLRLKQREVQLATLGVTADPSVVVEIDALRESIETLEAHQPISPIVAEAQQTARNQYNGDIEFLIAEGNVRNRRQTRLEEKQNDLAVQVGAIAQKILVVVDDIFLNKQDAEFGRMRNYRLQIVNLAILIGLVLYLVSLR